MYLPCISAAALCVAVLLLLLHLLLHAAAVRHRVPDGKNCCCGSLRLIPVFSFSSSLEQYLGLMYAQNPLAIRSH